MTRGNKYKLINHEFIPEVNTKILWPRKREVGVAYCCILLHGTMFNADAFRTGADVDVDVVKL